jgi:hypothetical protein
MDIKGVFWDASKAVPEFFIKTFLSILGSYIAIYIYVEDYMEIKEVKFLIVMTAFLLLILFSWKIAKDKYKQKILLSAFFILIIFVIVLLMVNQSLLDLHKDNISFFINYIYFIILNIVLIIIMNKLVNIIIKHLAK